MKADDEPDIQQPFNAILSILLILVRQESRVKLAN